MPTIYTFVNLYISIFLYIILYIYPNIHHKTQCLLTAVKLTENISTNENEDCTFDPIN